MGGNASDFTRINSDFLWLECVQIIPVSQIKKIIQGKTDPSRKPAGQGRDASFHWAFDLCCLTLLLATLGGQGNCFWSPAAYWFLYKGKDIGIVMVMSDPWMLVRCTTPPRHAQLRACLAYSEANNLPISSTPWKLRWMWGDLTTCIIICSCIEIFLAELKF